MKNILYVVVFFIPIIIISIGLFNENNRRVNSGFTLLVLVFFSFVGSSISEIKKKNIETSKLKLVIPLFILSISTIIFSAYINQIIVGGIVSLLLGSYSIVYLCKSKGV